MKSFTWVSIGVGALAGFVGGVMLMNNCRKVRNKVSDMQYALVDKIEMHKRKMIQNKMAKQEQYENDNLETEEDMPAKKSKPTNKKQ